MAVSFENYSRLNKAIQAQLAPELRKVHHMDTDSELFKYQYKAEKMIANRLGGQGVGTGSGTAALKLAVSSLGIKGEVLTVPNTYIATALSIIDSGAFPGYIDVDDSLLMDVNLIEDAITEKTQAIMPVHLYGAMVDMKKIRRIADKHGLRIIEDACQAHFARFARKSPGTFSDAACYSFYPNKILGGLSGGGMVISRSRSLLKQVSGMRDPMSGNSGLAISGRTPSFLDWSQIPYILARLGHTKSWIKRRKEIAAIYCEALEGLPVTTPVARKGVDHVYRDFVIMVRNREQLKKFLDRKKIETKIRYPYSLNKNPLFPGRDCPKAELAAKTVMSLPVNPFLADDEINEVIKAVRKFYH